MNKLNLTTKKQLNKAQRKFVFDLWNRVYPDTLCHETFEDFEDFLEKLIDPAYCLLEDEEANYYGLYIDFIREDEPWLILLLDDQVQRKGFGSQLIKWGQSRRNEINAWVLDHNHAKRRDGSTYYSPLNFYLKHQFEILPDIRLELKSISAVKLKWRKNNH